MAASLSDDGTGGGRIREKGGLNERLLVHVRRPPMPSGVGLARAPSVLTVCEENGHCPVGPNHDEGHMYGRDFIREERAPTPNA